MNNGLIFLSIAFFFSACNITADRPASSSGGRTTVSKCAYVDLDTVLARSKVATNASYRLRKKYVPKLNEINRLQSEYKQKYDSYHATKSSKDATQRRKERNAMRAILRKLKSRRSSYTRDHNTAKTTEWKRLEKLAKQNVAKVAKRKGYGVVEHVSKNQSRGRIRYLYIEEKFKGKKIVCGRKPVEITRKVITNMDNSN